MFKAPVFAKYLKLTSNGPVHYFLCVMLCITASTINNLSPISWGCRIHRLHLCRVVRLPQQVPWIWPYTTKWWGFSNAGVLGNVEYPSLPLLLVLLWPSVVAPDRVLSKSQIEQIVSKQMTDVKLWLLYSNIWNHLTVYKKGLFKNVTYLNVFTNQTHIWYICINRIWH